MKSTTKTFRFVLAIMLGVCCVSRSVGALVESNHAITHAFAESRAMPACVDDPCCAVGDDFFCQGECVDCIEFDGYANSGFFAGGEFLYVRPHFSEAIAFARGAQTLASYNAVAEPLAFDYSASMRAFLGYRLCDGAGEIRFTYWHLDSDVTVAAGNPGLGQFIVDPFGNLVGAVAIIDPSDARFGTVLVGGDSISTQASVQLNAFDIDFATSACMTNPCWSWNWSAGVRVAKVGQYYESLVFDAGGQVLSRGDFSVDFTGAGPRLGGALRRVFGRRNQFTAYANGNGSLLLGDYVVAFSNSPVAVFQANQSETMKRLIPVIDAEVGGSWRMNDHFTLSGGWLFQSWFDFGTSGGHFSGLFSGADDANIMSFDGLFVRGELAY